MTKQIAKNIYPFLAGILDEVEIIMKKSLENKIRDLIFNTRTAAIDLSYSNK
jgi:hypothetical protein